MSDQTCPLCAKIQRGFDATSRTRSVGGGVHLYVPEAPITPGHLIFTTATHHAALRESPVDIAKVLLAADTWAASTSIYDRYTLTLDGVTSWVADDPMAFHVTVNLIPRTDT